MPIDARAGEVSTFRLYPGYDIKAIPDFVSRRTSVWIDMNFASTTGETVKVGGNTYHVIRTTGTGNFQINRPVGSATIQVLGVGGGAAGRTGWSGTGGGSGGGGVADFANVTVAKGQYTATIGAGSTSRGSSGSNTTFVSDSAGTTLVNARGGGGPGQQGGCGGADGGTGFQGGNGGTSSFSGGGGGICGEGSSHGTWNCQTWFTSAGGGGVGSQGGSPNSNSRGGNGGQGASISNYDANLTAANFALLANGAADGTQATHFAPGEPGGGCHQYSPGQHDCGTGNWGGGSTSSIGGAMNQQGVAGNGVIIIRYAG